MMAEVKEASEKTYDYTITSLTTSYREVLVGTTKTQCYLVAHATYNYGTRYYVDQRKSGACDAEVYLIATKEYDASGNITTSVSTNTLPSQAEVLTAVKKIIEDQIASEVQETIYQEQIRLCMGKATTTIDTTDPVQLNSATK